MLTQIDSFNLNSPSNNFKLDIEVKGDPTVVKFDSDSSKLPDTKLELNSPGSNIQELKLGLLNSAEISAGEKVIGVFKEILKEKKIDSIENKISSGYVNLISKHLSSTPQNQNNYLEEFKKARDQVNLWFLSKNKVEFAKSLTLSQRVSLQKVYELYSDLKNKRDSLREELKQNVDLQEIQNLTQRSSAPEVNIIQSSLNTIDWQKDQIKIQKNPSTNSFLNPRSWGNWSRNPYKVFYDKEEQWKSDISQSNRNLFEIRKLERTIEKLSRSLIGWGPRFQWLIKEDTRKRDHLQSKMNAHIELQVAYKLLRYMNAPKT